MALFGNKETGGINEAAAGGAANEASAGGAINEAAAKAALDQNDWYQGMEGEGLETIDQSAVSTAYLTMVQPDSTMVTEDCPVGTWRNSATGLCLGPVVKVIPLAFKTVWIERDSNPPFMTVAVYDIGGCKIRAERPKPGKRGFPKMFNEETGNKVEELFVYAVLLADYPEEGVLYFSPTATSMQACKRWNSKLRAARLPSGKPAPIFGYEWALELDLVQNPAQPAKQLTKFVRATQGQLQARDTFYNYCAPLLTSIKNVGLLAAPEKSGDVEEEEAADF